MEFYTNQEAQQEALDTLGALLDSGVPAEWICERVSEAKTEYLCYRVLVEAGLLAPEEQPSEE